MVSKQERPFLKLLSPVANLPLRVSPEVLGKTWQPDERFLSYFQWLERQFDGHSRLEHSLGVCETSIQLAADFGLSSEGIEKAAIAGLLHDAAKLMPPALLFAKAEDYHMVLDQWDIASPQTLHPFVGAGMVEKELQIDDSDILNAIRYHTTGRVNMSPLEKIVYIADKTENRTRKPEYIALVCRDLAPNDPEALDKTVLNIMDETLRFLIDQKLSIHPRTLEARNGIVESLKQL